MLGEYLWECLPRVKRIQHLLRIRADVVGLVQLERCPIPHFDAVGLFETDEVGDEGCHGLGCGVVVVGVDEEDCGEVVGEGICRLETGRVVEFYYCDVVVSDEGCDGWVVAVCAAVHQDGAVLKVVELDGWGWVRYCRGC